MCMMLPQMLGILIISCSMLVPIMAKGDHPVMVGGLRPGNDEDIKVAKAIVAAPDIAAEIKKRAKDLSKPDALTIDVSPIEVLDVQTQLVAGTNYFLKIKIGSVIFHARIYRSFDGTTEVNNVIGPKKSADSVKYF